MQAVDLACNSTLDPSGADQSTMSEPSSPIHSSENPDNLNTRVENSCAENAKEDNVKNSRSNNDNNVVVRKERPSRACTQRAAARMQAAAEAEAAMAEKERKRKKAKRREKLAARLLKELSGYEDEEEEVEEGGGQAEEEMKEGEEQGGEENGSHLLSPQQLSKIITPLVGEPEASQLPRWNIRSMWQLASILNFLNVFRHLLNIKVEFSAEEFETALITPNNTLGDIHMPLLKAIPPVTRMALGHGTWITVLCRKLRDWWHWVAEGDIPIVASHGAEVEAYKALDPGVRMVILKALCDIRAEQEDIRNFIDDSIKHGVPLSVFRKERIGGDSHGISYWYEDDPIIGQRIYREIRKVEVKKGKGKSIPPIPHSCYQWEVVATNLDEFQTVSEKLFSSKNRTEVSVGKKLKRDMLPEVEKIHKKKERLLKKQHRQALMLDNLINIDGLGAGRSLRYRKPVTYTFDDYDRSINEAIKVTKNNPSPEPSDRRDPHIKHEASTNGGWSGPSEYSQHASFSSLSPKSPDNDEFYDNHKAETVDFSNRQRQRPQRLNEFVEEVSDYEADSDSDDDIVGEVVYDEEYLKSRKKRRKTSSSSEGDEEYIGDEENPEEEEEEEEEDEDTSSTSEESDDEPRKYKPKPLPSRTRREAKLRSVDELQSGLRRSKRATRTRIDYRQIEMSDSENALDERPTGSDNEEFSKENRDSESPSSDEKREMQVDRTAEEHHEINDEDQTHLTHPPEMLNEVVEDKVDGVQKRHFLDLNELAPGSGFDDVPNSVKDEDEDNF